MSTVTKLSSDQFPKVTRAAILVEQRQPLVVDEIALPDHLDVGQVLIELAYSGICGSQLGEIDGVKGPDKWLPHLLGHEASGTVMAVGPGVRHVKPGDTVVAHWKPSLGIGAARGAAAVGLAVAAGAGMAAVDTRKSDPGSVPGNL